MKERQQLDGCKSDYELNTLREKVHVYEQFLHQLQLFAEVVLDNKKTSVMPVVGHMLIEWAMEHYPMKNNTN
jgi:hypothetical protein